MKTMLSVLAAVFFVAFSVLAQPHPNILWTHTYGGGGDDQCWSVRQTSDGGYILSGWTWSFGSGQSDFYLVKTDNQGVCQGTRTFGGGGRDESYAVLQSSEGGYIVAGNTQSFGAGGGDLYVVKTDDHGFVQWTRTYGGSGNDACRCIQQTSDGGYILTGVKDLLGAGGWNVYLVKISAQGDLIWERTFGGPNTEYAVSVQQTTDRGFIMVGLTESYGSGGSDFYVVKTDSLGNTQWTQTFGGGADELANSVQQTTDGGFIIAGWTCSFGAGNSDYYVVKTNSQGIAQWTRTYGGTGFDAASSVEQTTDGGYLVGGCSASISSGGKDFLLIKVDADGNPQWKRTYGGGSDELWGCISSTMDGGYVIGGFTFSFGAGSDDFYLVKTGPDQMVLAAEAIKTTTPNDHALYPNYPNPFNSITKISYCLPIRSNVSLNIFNPLGQEVGTLVNAIQPAGTYTVSFDGLGLTSGIYFYQLQAGEFVQTKKMIMLK